MIRKYDEVFAIDGKPMLKPDLGTDVSETDIDEDDSGRDEAKVMHRFVAREGVRTWSFSYALLDKEDFEYIKSLFAGKSEFVFTYDEGQTTNAYSSKRTYREHHNHEQNGLYKNLKFNIIEC